MKKRRNVLLINPQFQFRFMLYVVSFLLALSFIYPLVIDGLFDHFTRLLVERGMSSDLQTIQSTRQDVFWLLIGVQGTFLLLASFVSFFISHRIAGPIYKLKQTMDAAREGAINRNLVFRKKDHFQEITESYNALMASLAGDVNLERVSNVIAQLEELEKTASDEARVALRAAIVDLKKVRNPRSS
jgi:methyl-accepting chemotaxis protein